MFAISRPFAIPISDSLHVNLSWESVQEFQEITKLNDSGVTSISSLFRRDGEQPDWCTRHLKWKSDFLGGVP
jgi:hypothetical protein